MTTFILVHGAWHGAWCWGRVVNELMSAGYRTVAVDLPCDDVDAGWRRYTDCILEAVPDTGYQLVAVGHSLGGGVVPLLASELPVDRLVFLAAFPPEPGRSLSDSTNEEPGLTEPAAQAFKQSFDGEGRLIWPNFETANFAMYHDCSREDAVTAFSRWRPQARTPFDEPWPLLDWPDVPMTFIVCSEDRMGPAECLARVAQRRWGVEAVYIESGHSPFFSRPHELVNALLGG